MKLNEIIYSPKHAGVNNIWMYVAIIGIGFINMFPETILPEVMALIPAMALTILAVVMDRKQLTEAGLEAPSAWWVLFMPVYWWKRTKYVGSGWIVGLVIALLIYCGQTWYGVTKAMGGEIDKVACEITTDVLKSNGLGQLRCMKVVRDRQVVDNMWLGYATDNGGNIWDLVITYNPDTNYVEVQVKDGDE